MSAAICSIFARTEPSASALRTSAAICAPDSSVLLNVTVTFVCPFEIAPVRPFIEPEASTPIRSRVTMSKAPNSARTRRVDEKRVRMS